LISLLLVPSQVKAFHSLAPLPLPRKVFSSKNVSAGVFLDRPARNLYKISAHGRIACTCELGKCAIRKLQSRHHIFRAV